MEVSDLHPFNNLADTFYSQPLLSITFVEIYCMMGKTWKNLAL